MREDFLEAMSRAANSVYVVTTEGPGGRAGVTVSSVTSVSADAPTMLVCVHHLSPAAAAIATNNAFCINLLAEGQAHIADTFAGLTGAKGEDKFACAEWDRAVTGAPVLKGALAMFDCRLVHSLRVGSHHIFVGELQKVGLAPRGAALVYSNRAYSRAEPLG